MVCLVGLVADVVKFRGFRCWSRGKKIKYFDPVFWCGPGWCVLLEFRSAGVPECWNELFCLGCGL